MVAMTQTPVIVLDDGWTAPTENGSLSAHFEHTVAVTEDGPQVLTAKETMNTREGDKRGA
jgi:methionyl aminopeptidase